MAWTNWSAAPDDTLHTTTLITTRLSWLDGGVGGGDDEGDTGKRVNEKVRSCCFSFASWTRRVSGWFGSS